MESEINDAQSIKPIETNGEHSIPSLVEGNVTGIFDFAPLLVSITPSILHIISSYIISITNER